MSTPKVPPHIAKQIAAMKPQAAPAPKSPAPPPQARPAPGGSAGGGAGKVLGALAALGWLAALGAGAAGYSVYKNADAAKSAALAEQAAAYDAQIAQINAGIAQIKADAAAALKKAQDDATAQQMVLQTELEFQKLPEFPLETTFRANQVLYVESRLDEPFTCKVRLFRPIGGVTREIEYTIKARTFQDLGALDTWVFAKGDKLEFVKSGYKPRSLVVP